MSTVSYLSSAVTTSASSSTTDTTSSSTDLSANKTAFLSLLTTQLEHQDPLDPVDTTEFTNQLISYSSLEQLMNINSSLEDVLSAITTSTTLSSSQYVGSTVEVNSSSTALQEGTAEWNYIVTDDASSAVLQVSNADGDVLYSQTLTNVTAGTYDLSISADELGTNLTDGSLYTLNIVATDSSGDTVDTSAYGVVRVDKVQVSGDTTSLTAGDLTFTSDDILSYTQTA
ncbi:MAG: flagellar hook capping FlgD N-terminal domain-containing protein [Pseudobdellovibrionaceae bacterium]